MPENAIPMTNSRHPRLAEQSQRRLDQARETAHQKTGYDSEATRQALVNRYGELTGNTAYKWQLDVAEALILKLDCVVSFITLTAALSNFHFRALCIFIVGITKVDITSPVVPLN
ncbi:hypothetical protein E1B28_011157 [Marasmius oreades]|uniref:Uncharacterized protein n=1 Tax=Marasmius oreades TaxID=181124 RepID=A0A9P7RTM6_9AGAR|nr:uncharacterized protein E1B28_011157 [Marasmius oreades]KAG7089475.1 hypothetical protein E1B28_011157 [Marasmius oreades]